MSPRLEWLALRAGRPWPEAFYALPPDSPGRACCRLLPSGRVILAHQAEAWT